MSELPEAAVEAGEVGEPSWVDSLPEKFRSNPGTFADSYRHLEQKVTELGQHNAELRETVDAWVNEMDAASPDVAPRPDRGQTLAQVQRLTEEAAFRSAKQVVDAISSNRVPAPSDPDMLAMTASQMMPSVDAAWAATDPRLLANVLESRPELLSEERLGDMQSVVSDLSTAAALARGVQAENTLQSYRRAEDMRDAKRNAQTLTGQTGRGPSADDDEVAWERIQAAHSKTWANSQSG